MLPHLSTKSHDHTGSSEGSEELRKLIAKEFYEDRVAADEIIISDGTKPDLARLQLLFGDRVTVAVQNPGYPAFVDGSVLSGKTGDIFPTTGYYDNIQYLQCLPENDFFPDLNVEPTDLIYFHSPHNPTGCAATHEQLKELVDFALRHNSIIIFDSAYREFISDPSLPKSIFEIPGAHKCAIETGSFSKSAGFSGLRLGWTVCPKTITYEDGTSLLSDWKVVVDVMTDGPSIMASFAGTFAMKNLHGLRHAIEYYMENSKAIRDVMERKDIACYGGVNSPFVWCKIDGKSSWDMFESLLQMGVVCAPGSGFGSCGDEFIRFSCFALHEDVAQACTILEAWDPRECKDRK